MIRRSFLALSVAIGLLGFGQAFAVTGDNTVSGFDEALQAGGPVMMHITAPWCTECKLQKPIVAKLLATPEFQNMKKFDVDFDTQKAVLKRYRVQMQSTIIVFKDGKEVDRKTGITKQAAIEALLRKAL